jgi:hypothetical protein
MADLLVVAIMAAFFAVAALFVVACERIVGASTSYEGGKAEPESTPPAEPSKAAA